MRAGLRSAWGPAGAVVAGFAVSRCVYYALGVRFTPNAVNDAFQFVDPDLLRHDLAESLWNLHTQPPLFNLFLGVVLKTSGSDYAHVLHAVWVGLGLVIALGLYRLMCRLGVGAWPAAALAVAFSITPPAILYENWFYIDHAMAALLVLAAVFIHRFAGTGRTRDAFVAFSLLAAVVLSRTFFHLAWLVTVVALVWLMQKPRRRKVLVAAALPLALCLGVYVKTLVQFGDFGSTTCSGVSLAKMTTQRLDPGKRASMIRSGELSEFAAYFYGDLPYRRPDLFRRERPRGIALLDRRLKSTGFLNLEHAAFLRICDRYMDDAIASMKADPRVLRRGFQITGPIYWRPASQYYFMRPANRRAVRHVEVVYRVLLAQPRRAELTLRGSTEPDSGPEHLLEVAWTLVAAYAALLLLGARLLLRARARGDLAAADATTMAFILLTMVYVTAVGVLFEVGENNRFRYLAEPLVFGALVGLVGAFVRERRESD